MTYERAAGNGSARSQAPALALRILVVAGSEEPTKSVDKWQRHLPGVTLRVVRARADGAVRVPAGYEGAMIVDGLRHSTAYKVRGIYPGAPRAPRIHVHRVIGSLVHRLGVA